MIPALLLPVALELYDNLRCHQWRQSGLRDNSTFSVKDKKDFRSFYLYKESIYKERRSLYQNEAYKPKALGSTSITHRSDTSASDRSLIDVDPNVFAIWGCDTTRGSSPLIHWNGNVAIWTKLSSLAAPEIIILTTSTAANHEDVVEIKTFSFQESTIVFAIVNNINVSVKMLEIH